MRKWERFEALCKEPMFGYFARLEIKFRQFSEKSTLSVDDRTFGVLEQELAKHKVNDCYGQDCYAVYGPVTSITIGTLTLNKTSAEFKRILAVVDMRILWIQKAQETNTIRRDTANSLVSELSQVRRDLERLHPH